MTVRCDIASLGEYRTLQHGRQRTTQELHLRKHGPRVITLDGDPIHFATRWSSATLDQKRPTTWRIHTHNAVNGNRMACCG
jgi:hypothetical protein